MASKSRLAYGLVGAAAAVAAGGAAAGTFVVQRRKRAGRTDPPAVFEDLDPDRSSTVSAEDGVALHVEEIGPVDAPLTVVFAHGYTLSLRSFYYQREALTRKFGDQVRLVLYDQRGHGKSGPVVPGGATIDQLGRDLFQVLDTVVPSGPVVLVGHSMGGMTLLSLVDQYPSLFLPATLKKRVQPARVVGVALLSTSSGNMAGVSLGLPALIARLKGPLAPFLLRNARRQAALVEHGRRVGGDLAWVITCRFSFGGSNVGPEVVDFLDALIAGTRIETIADFYPALMTLDLGRALPTLVDTDVVIVGAERDVMTPVEHSVVMAEALPKAEFIRIPDVGHVVLLESPRIVDEALIGLVSRSLDRVSAADKAGRRWRS